MPLKGAAMKLLAALLVLAPLFADDPLGVVVWKGDDLKQRATTQELHNSVDYQAIVVHQTGNGQGDLSELAAELLVIESGEATLVTGGEKTSLSPGDVVHIPAKLPRQVVVAPGKDVTYLVIKQRSGDEDEPPSLPPDPNVRPKIGIETGDGYRACVVSDTSPPGTVFEGYKKMVSHSFMGPNCVWAREGDPPTHVSTSKDKPRIGADMGGGFRSCVAGDETPSGTIVDGYRKESHPSPFGLSCAWEKIK
jgi:mannose-6-phosphate isomerase-like protein (cupin superfamily)